MLWRKLLRDLWRQRWQTIPILLVLGLGTAVFVACFIGYDSLAVSYRLTQERTRLADMTLTVSDVSPAQLRQVRSIPGVTDALAQTVATLPVRFANVQAEARLVGIPLSAQPSINQMVVETGHYPASADEVLVEHHFAAYHSLEPGAALRLVTPSGDRRLTVAGVAVSAEYLWVARNDFDVMPSAADFGVLFVPESALSGLNGESRLLYRLAPGANPDETLARVKAVLGADTVQAATRRADLIGIRLLQDDIDGFAEAATVVPGFFLAVVVLVLATIMSRRVDRERPIIGTMLALGASRMSMLGHYVGYGLVTGLLATGLGSAAGILLGFQFAAAYVRELLIPFVTLRVNGWALVIAFALGLAAALLACLLPAWRAAAYHPAEAMRPFQSVRAPRHSGRLSRTPLLLRLALRNLGRQPLRTSGAIAGVVAALVLLVGVGGMLDSMSRLLQLALDEGPRYDLRADFSLPQPSSELETTVRRLDGVGVGDEVELVFREHGKQVRRMVGALSGDFMTEPVALFGPETAETLGLTGAASTVLVRTAPDGNDHVRAALAQLPAATRLTTMPDFRRQIRELMSLAYVLIGTLFGCGAVLAGCILFNTVTMGVAERRRELATMRADGHSMRTIVGLVTLENLTTGLGGAALGLPLGLVVLRLLVATFHSDLFSLPFVISPLTLALAAATILAVALTAQVPALIMVAGPTWRKRPGPGNDRTPPSRFTAVLKSQSPSRSSVRGFVLGINRPGRRGALRGPIPLPQRPVPT